MSYRPVRLWLRKSQSAFTLYEMLLVGLIMSFLMIYLCKTFQVQAISFFNVVYQNRVDSDARAAMDTICDDMRYGGDLSDELQTGSNAQLNPIFNPGPQVINTTTFSGLFNAITYNEAGTNSTNSSVYLFQTPNNDTGNYYKGVAPPIYELVRDDNEGRLTSRSGISPYIQSVSFEYEYRYSSQGGTNWTYYRSSTPDVGPAHPTNSQAQYCITAVYVTVNASASIPWLGTNGQSPVYQRTITSVVHLRAPYVVGNGGLPRAVE